MCFCCCWCFWFIFARDFRESAINRECQQNRHIGTYSTHGQQLTSKSIFCKFSFDFTLFSHCPYDYPKKTHTNKTVYHWKWSATVFLGYYVVFYGVYKIRCCVALLLIQSLFIYIYMYMYIYTCVFITTRALLLMSIILIAWLGSIN